MTAQLDLRRCREMQLVRQSEVAWPHYQLAQQAADSIKQSPRVMPSNDCRRCRTIPGFQREAFSIVAQHGFHFFGVAAGKLSNF